MARFDSDEMSRLVAAALRTRGWRTTARRGADAFFVTAVHPATSSDLVIGARVLGHRWKHSGLVQAVVEPAVGLEAAMNLAVGLGLPPTASWFFARNPDGPPNRLTNSSDDAATVINWIAETATHLVPQWSERYSGTPELLAAIESQPRLEAADRVISRTLVMAATGSPTQALALLARSIGHVDRDDLRGNGWMTMARPVNARLMDWIDRGQPPPPRWNADDDGRTAG